MSAAILVNLAAGNGSAERKWKAIQSQILRDLSPQTRVVTYHPPFDLGSCIRALHEDLKITCFISAGGDGTLHFILNEVFALFNTCSDVPSIGAIGLGSSNDYHKPFGRKIQDIPVRIDASLITKADLGKVTFRNEQPEPSVRYFVTGANIGLIAEANFLFNREDIVIALLKKRFLNSCILYTALKTILSYRNRPVKLRFDSESMDIDLTNVSLVKTNHISGGFQYDLEIARDDGWLGLHLCEGMNTSQRIQVLCDLSRKKFNGRKKRRSSLVKSVCVEAPAPFCLETDGEVQLARSAHFTVVPGAVKLLG